MAESREAYPVIITTCVDGLTARAACRTPEAVRTRKMQVGQDRTKLPGASVDERDSCEAIGRRGHAVAAGSEMLGE